MPTHTGVAFHHPPLIHLHTQQDTEDDRLCFSGRCFVTGYCQDSKIASLARDTPAGPAESGMYAVIPFYGEASAPAVFIWLE